MSAEVVDFGARLSAIRLGLQAARHSEGTAEITSPGKDVEDSRIDNSLPGKIDVTELQSALMELRAELLKKQAALDGDGMDLSSALNLDAQAEVILRDLTNLATEIAALRRGSPSPVLNHEEGP